MTRDEVLAQLLSRVDALEQRVAQLEPQTDPWLEPFPTPSPSLNDSPGGESQVGSDDLAGLDPDERAAVEAARQRLANDTGSIAERPDPGRRSTLDGETIELPPVDPERAAQRRVLAAEMALDQEFGATAIDTYTVGGPLWLYYGNREFVLGLPDHVKRAMVEDVEQDSRQEALEMARDLLKVRGAQGPNLG